MLNDSFAWVILLILPCCTRNVADFSAVVLPCLSLLAGGHHGACPEMFSTDKHSKYVKEILYSDDELGLGAVCDHPIYPEVACCSCSLYLLFHI